jgi:hypothetical protein
VDNVVFAGDINLDTARRGNVRYGHRFLMLAHDTAIWRSGRPTATAATPTTRLSGSWQRMSRRRSRNCNGW